MKKAAILFVLIFAAGMLFTSCNKQACPAYQTDAETEQFDNQG